MLFTSKARLAFCAVRLYSHIRRLPAVTLFTKDDCSLCEEAKQLLLPHGHKFVYQEVDITAPGEEHWYEKYKFDIPVLHVEGTVVMKHRFYEKPLLDALKNAAVRASGDVELT